MKITDYEKNHGKFVHEDWLQKIINLVPNLVQLTDAKSIEAIHFENDVTLVDYINQDGELVEGEPVASYLTANVTGDGSMGHIKTISFLNVYGEPTVLAGIELQDYDPNVPYKTFNFDDSIRYAFDNSSDKFIATDKQLGIVKYSKTNPTRVDADGTINTHYDGTGIGLNDNHDLALLPATKTTLGGLRSNTESLTITDDGYIYANWATLDSVGVVKPDGTTITVDDQGTIKATPQNLPTIQESSVTAADSITLSNATTASVVTETRTTSSSKYPKLSRLIFASLSFTVGSSTVPAKTAIFTLAVKPNGNYEQILKAVGSDGNLYHFRFNNTNMNATIETIEPLPFGKIFDMTGQVQ